ncbi:hypothetical protein GOBAR_DD15722 [Gossypium barbadense]|nr:hypothetical protein GOBAR_DD15722 [Gossypium barbadense]
MYSVFSKFVAPSTLVSDRCWKNMNNLVLSLAPKFTKLLTLVLRQENLQLEDTAFETIAKFCHDLQDLDLSKSFKLAATDCALQAIGQNCNMLHSLNLGWCDNVGDLGVTSLAYGCPDLRCLDLCGCVRITGVRGANSERGEADLRVLRRLDVCWRRGLATARVFFF